MDDISSLNIERLLVMVNDDPDNTRLINNIGWCYAHGQHGATVDLQKAVEWFCRSARGGDELGCFNIGFHYREGRGLARNGEISRYCWRHALLI
jgi:TPR repeat protein